MKAFTAFFKKEILDLFRSGKALFLLILFFAVGIMNPAIAKLTPDLMKLLSAELAESGMVVTDVTVDALTSWTQFFKNIPMALIAFILICGGCFTKEYDSGTLVLILTKGISRRNVLLAKAALLLSVWSLGYWLCFAVTYGYNAYFWDNGIATGLIPASVNWYLFGILVTALTVLFSVTASGYGSVLLGTGGSVLALYVISFLPKIAKYSPASLMNSASLLVGTELAADYIPAIASAAVISIACVALSIPIFNKKQV